MIGTPALDGKVEAWYVDSLVRTVKAGFANGVEVSPLLLINESILPMARNELVNYAVGGDVDCLVFIDSDQAWDEKCFLDVVTSDLDVIGVPVVNKSDQEGYNVFLDSETEVPEDGIVYVDAIGTGFLKISRAALSDLYEKSEDVYFRGKSMKHVFEYLRLPSSSFMGEDVVLCKKLQALGYKIAVDTRWTCTHVGTKVWRGDFAQFHTRTQGKTP